MKKILIVLFSLSVFLVLFGCTSDKSKTSETNNNGIVSSDSTVINDQEEKPEDLSDLKNAPFKVVCKSRVKIRRSPSLDSDVLGYVDEGDRFEVYETYDDGEYIWNRIFDNCWVANDGEWLKRIPYKEYIDDYIVELVKFPVPKEIHENIHSDSGNHIFDANNVRLCHNKWLIFDEK